MDRRTFLCGLTLGALAGPFAAAAQAPAKIPRIGYLGPVSPSAGSRLLESFWQGLRRIMYRAMNSPSGLVACRADRRSP
jgi:hypothetical protein